MNRFTFLILAAILAILMLSGYVFLSIRIHSLLASAAAAREGAAAAGAAASLQQGIQDFLSATQAERTDLSAYVATDADVVSLIQEVQDVAKKEKVTATVGAIAVAPTDWKYHEPLEMSLSATGSLPALAAFATDLESLPQTSHLSAASFEASGKGVWFARFTVDFVKEKPAQ